MKPLPESLLKPLPYLTPELPGLGGVLKHIPEDFVVEEIPAYQPSGKGEHLFLWIEKNDWSADQLLQYLSKTLQVHRRDIGMAGIKDRRAITRQYISVPAKCLLKNRAVDVPELHQPTEWLEQAKVLNCDRCQVLSAACHGNKLKTGHLRGNHFTIHIREPITTALPQLPVIIETIRNKGFLNYYGEQRFGRDAETLQLGWDLIFRQKEKSSIPGSQRAFLLRLALSAIQSALFNDYLNRRLLLDELFHVQLGDVMEVVASGGKFIIEADLHREQQRFELRETVMTGPMFGRKMKQPTGLPANWEEMLLQDYAITPAHFQGWGDLMDGTRRACLIHVTDLASHTNDTGVTLEFTLPSGVYATSLLREICKTDQAGS